MQNVPVLLLVDDEALIRDSLAATLGHASGGFPSSIVIQKPLASARLLTAISTLRNLTTAACRSIISRVHISKRGDSM